MMRLAFVYLACLIVYTLGGPVPSVTSDKNIIENLVNGSVELESEVKLKGEQYWQSEDGQERGYAYYGYKYEELYEIRLGRFLHDIRLSRGDASVGVSHTPIIVNRAEYHAENGRAEFHTTPRTDSVLNTDHTYLTNTSRPKLGYVCPYVPMTFPGFPIRNLTMDEDCLFLDVYLPPVKKDQQKTWPVLFWIYGGGFRNKVSAAVAMSGSVVRPWSIRLNPEKGTKVLAARLGCPTETSAAIIECLKTQSVEQLLNASAETVEKGPGFQMYYAPVIDGIHITKDPAQLLKERAAEPASALPTATLISGHLAQDSSGFLLATPHLLNGTFNLTMASNLLAGFLIGATGPTCLTNIPLQVKHVFEYYNITDAMKDTEVRQRYFTISTDVMFGLGAIVESLLYANASSNSSNQMYLISFDPGFRGLGAFHFMEVAHLFRGRMDQFLKEKTSDLVTKSLHDFIREIAHNGRAAGPSFGSEGNYLELNQEAEWINKKQNFSSLVQFWKGLKNLPCPAPTA